MFGLHVRINDGEPIICGANDLGVISANVNGVGRLGPTSLQGSSDEIAFELTVGGLTARGSGANNEYLSWVKENLKVGDKVTIHIVEADSSNLILLSNPTKKNVPMS